MLPESVRVVQEDWSLVPISRWMEKLEETLQTIGAPVVLIAHSAGAITVAHWAASLRRSVHGALLVAPPDFEERLPPWLPGMDVVTEFGWAPTPRSRLPFPSVVVASRNDPFDHLQKTASYAASWGSRFVDAGNLGHINSESGLGSWDEGLAILNDLVASSSR